jgi:hypothetical protein
MLWAGSRFQFPLYESFLVAPGGYRVLLRGNNIDLSPAVQLAGHHRRIDGAPANLHAAG